MKDILLSVIVPVYNKEAYIKRCISSIADCCDTIEYEIIVINDGSNDNSLDEIKKMMCENHHILLIDQDNLGVSCARNVGLNLARGKYVFFVDADDYIDKSSVCEIRKYLVNDESDIILFGYTNKYNDIVEKVLCFPETTTKVVIDNGKDVEVLLKCRILHNIGTKIYKKNLLKDLQFNEEISLYEDVSFCLQAMTKAKKIVYVNSAVYIYERNVKDSLSSIYIDTMYDSVCYFIRILGLFCARFQIDSSSVNMLKRAIVQRCIINYSSRGYNTFSKYLIKIRSRQLIDSDNEYLVSFDQKIFYLLYNRKDDRLLFLYIILSEKLKRLKREVFV